MENGSQWREVVWGLLAQVVYAFYLARNEMKAKQKTWLRFLLQNQIFFINSNQPNDGNQLSKKGYNLVGQKLGLNELGLGKKTKTERV